MPHNTEPTPVAIIKQRLERAQMIRLLTELVNSSSDTESCSPGPPSTYTYCIHCKGRWPCKNTRTCVVGKAALLLKQLTGHMDSTR